MSRTLFGGGIATLVLIALFLSTGDPAEAYQPMPQNDSYEILLPAFDLYGYESPAREARSLESTDRLTARYGGRWHVQAWNSQTGTPRFVYGPSVQLSGPVTDATQLEELARMVIAENTDVLRADNDHLRLTATPNALGKWVAHFQQTYHGLDVWNARVRIAFAEDGRLMVMSSDYYSDIELDPNPSISAESATEVAVLGVPFDDSTDRIEDGIDLLVLPLPISETEVRHHLVWRVRVRTADPLGIWVTHVDAHNGEILWRYNDILFAYHGDTESEVQPNTYCNGTETQAMPYLRINVNGVGTVTSASDGTWSIDGTGGARTVTCDLYGPYVDLNNDGGAEAAYSGTAQEDVALTVRFDDTNAQRDERDVFDAVNDIHDFFQLFAPEFGYPNQRISAYVSRTDGYCPGNAWWDGTINFCAAGGSYANTGEIQQVVHHEFGHGVQRDILGGDGNEGLGEGNSDILGNLMTQESIIGRGFFQDNCTSGIRDALNNLIYPDDVVGQSIHYAGQVIAGFNWDAMVLLQDMYGEDTGTVMSAERWHYGRVLWHPWEQPDQVYATFLADDDDGDIDNGTPHHAIFCEAASNHNFDCPEVLVGVFMNHEDHPYTSNRTDDYEIVGTAFSLPAGEGYIEPSTVALHYRVGGGGFTDVAMTPTGAPDEYEGVIPAQPWGSVVTYYLSAENNLGDYGTTPRNAPTDLHYFQVNDEFADEMEWETAWTGGAAGDDASSGRWECVDPIGTESNGNPVQPEDDHTMLGLCCWITGQHVAGETAGYNDVDNGTTTLLSPLFDLNGATAVSVSYCRWYTNDAGNNPGEDWWNVDVSNDGGETWSSVEHTQASAAMWTEIAFDLADYYAVPDIVQFRFVADDTPPGALVEAGIDDFLLAAVFPSAGADGNLGIRFITDLGQNRPNPFNPMTEISFSMEQAGPASLKVYDANGRRVRSLAEGPFTAGKHHLTWDGTDDGGHPLAAGTYFYRLEANGKTFSARMVFLK